MSTALKTNPHKEVFQLKLIRGGRNKKEDRFIQATWIVAQSALWNTSTFSSKEIAEFKALIAEHFENRKQAQVNFKELIQRICLAKRYVARKPGRYIPKPADWLNIHYTCGIAGTARWLEEVKAQRKTVPKYNIGISILANGICKYLQQPDQKTFSSYRNKLLKENQHVLLQIFYNTIVNIQYPLV